MAYNNGINNVMNIDYLVRDKDVDPLTLLYNNISHESIHQIARSKDGTKTGFQIEEKYRGINETCTEYFSQLARNGKSYTQMTGKVACGYWHSVRQLTRLINAGIFTNDELSRSYVTNDVSYLKDSILKYVDEKTYNTFLAVFNHSNVSKNEFVNLGGEFMLDAIVSEIILRKKFFS